MTNPILIECRSKDGLLVNSNNSDYQTILQQKIEINEGDSIVIRKSFFDTESSNNQKINIDEDLTIGGSVIQYLTNTTKTNITIPAGVDWDNHIDGTEFFNCYKIPNASKEKFYELDKVKVSAYGSQTTGFGNFDYTIQYKTAQADGNGHLVNQQFHAPFGDARTGKPVIYGTVGIIYDPEFTPIITSPSKSEQEKQYESVLTLEPGTPVEDDTMKMVENHFTAVLPKGSYSPIDLCTTLNRQFNINTGPSNYADAPVDVAPLSNLNPMVSPFLQTTSNLGGGRPDSYLWKSDGTMWYRYVEAPALRPVYVGATQMELAWNEDQQIFLWNYAHFPYYNGADEVSGIGVSLHTDGNYSRFKMTKRGGVCFTGLTAQNAESKFDGGEFWFNKLGFTRDLVVEYNYKDIPVGIEFEGRTPQIVSTLQEGTNMTGGYFGLDQMINKTGTGEDFFEVPNPNADFLATITNTTPINASSSSINAQYNFGYFLIDVETQFKHDYLTPNQNLRNVSSVVGRFYEQNSYTTGDEGIVYTHRGNPLLLEGFRIRILQSDKKIATLGDDNTIIFEVIKAK